MFSDLTGKVRSADNPLIDPKDDRLGYASFAKNLAESLCKMTSPEGFVVAVYGSWGSGKSTLLNFVVYYLEQKRHNRQITSEKSNLINLWHRIPILKKVLKKYKGCKI